MSFGAWLLYFMTPLMLVASANDNLIEPPESQHNTGILVVTYNTGRNGERLARMRFRLINEAGEQVMYPRASAFFENAEGHTRRVTIPGLPPGQYIVEAIVPNRDGLFADVPSRPITIVEGDICKIDLTLKPRYGRVKATALIPAAYGSSSPTIHLHDRKGNSLLTAQGDLDTNNLLPGQYTLFFEPYMDLIAPEPIHFSVYPGAVIGPFERYYKHPGISEAQIADYYPHTMSQLQSTRLPEPLEPPASEMWPNGTMTALAGHPHRSNSPSSLHIIGILPTGNSVTLLVTSANGTVIKHQKARAKDGQIHWAIPDLAPGVYTLTWELPSIFLPMPQQTVQVAPSAQEAIEVRFVEGHAIRVTTNIDEANFNLKHIESGEERSGRGRRYAFRNLPPGTYLLTLASPTDSTIVAPDPITIELSGHEDRYIHATFP